MSDPDTAHPNAAENLGERQINRIPAYKVFEATASMPEDLRLAVRWLHGHYYDSGRSLVEIGEFIGYDGGVISKLFNGRYEGDLEKVVRQIVRYRRLTEERATMNKAPYIETQLYRQIEECCQAALAYQKIVYLFGESQVGKTEALKHYAAKHNHGETTYVEMPAGGSISHFLAALAEKLRMSKQARGDVLALNIMRCLGPNNLIIIDEASRALQARSYGGSNLKTLDFIRSLHDNTGCGIVLCGTNVFRDSMRDAGLAKFLNQFNRRCLLRRQLPDVPSRADLNAFARHYELEPASGPAYELQRAVVHEHGLGVWLTMLRLAAHKCTKAKKTMTWDDVHKAHAFLRKMEQTQTVEE